MVDILGDDFTSDINELRTDVNGLNDRLTNLGKCALGLKPEADVSGLNTLTNELANGVKIVHEALLESRDKYEEQFESINQLRMSSQRYGAEFTPIEKQVEDLGIRLDNLLYEMSGIAMSLEWGVKNIHDSLLKFNSESDKSSIESPPAVS